MPQPGTAFHFVRGSEVRKADYPVESLFVDRWSGRAMSGEEIPEQDLLTMLEAARWAPSSYNLQPWRILYARRETEYWPVFLDLLLPGNRIWADKAGVLLLFISKTISDRDGKPTKTHSFDTGAAWENLALQAYLKGYMAHGMQGFDYERARTVLSIPIEYQLEAMGALGKPAPKEVLPEELQKREIPNDRRKLSETAWEGPFRR